MPAFDRPLLVIDIETVPDRAFHQGEDFPKPIHHQVVEVGYLLANWVQSGATGEYQVEAVGCCSEDAIGEADIVRNALDLIEAAEPRLVTFNGRAFDLPVLRYRAMKHGIAAPWLSQGEGKWENYDFRYRVDWHCDLMDALSGFGASKPASLAELCGLLGITCKQGMTGADVERLYHAGDMAAIRAYAMDDVKATYQAFLRFAAFRGEVPGIGE